MKIIHGALSSLLTEVKEQGKVDGVRVAAMMQSTFECAGLPRYTSWVIVSAHVGRPSLLRSGRFCGFNRAISRIVDDVSGLNERTTIARTGENGAAHVPAALSPSARKFS